MSRHQRSLPFAGQALIAGPTRSGSGVSGPSRTHAAGSSRPMEAPRGPAAVLGAAGGMADLVRSSSRIDVSSAAPAAAVPGRQTPLSARSVGRGGRAPSPIVSPPRATGAAGGAAAPRSMSAGAAAGPPSVFPPSHPSSVDRRKLQGGASAGAAAGGPAGPTVPDVVSAVALQDHFIKSMGLDLSLSGRGHAASGRGKRVKVQHVDRLQARIEEQRRALRKAGERSAKVALATVDDAPDVDLTAYNWVCDKCTLTNAGSVTVCAACGRTRTQAAADDRHITLAQKLGLVAQPQAMLTATEWENVAKQSKERHHGEGECPICMEPFGMEEQVLLSCSHIFHRHCLDSFERFVAAAQRTCPFCRQANYQKARTVQGAKALRQNSAIVIQKWMRRYHCQLQYRAKLKEMYAAGGGNEKRRRAFFAARLESVSTKVDKVFAARDDALDALFQHLDRQIAQSRRVLDAHEHRLQAKTGAPAAGVPDVDWTAIADTAEKRRDTVCPICINEFSTNQTRQRTLLSCSHVFHDKCIQAFERFNLLDKPTCPVCRAHYTRRLIDN